MKKTVLVCGIYLAAASAVFAQATSVNDNAERPQGPGQERQREAGRVSGGSAGAVDVGSWRLPRSHQQRRDQVRLRAQVLQSRGRRPPGSHPPRRARLRAAASWCSSAPTWATARPARRPARPRPATITGVIEAADIIGPAGQGIAAGQFDEFLRAIRADSAYVNVHTSAVPGRRDPGEHRRSGGGHGHDDD